MEKIFLHGILVFIFSVWTASAQSGMGVTYSSNNTRVNTEPSSSSTSNSSSGMSARDKMEIGQAAGSAAKGISQAGSDSSARQNAAAAITTTVGLAQLVFGGILYFGPGCTSVVKTDCVPGIVLMISGVAGLGQGSLDATASRGSRLTSRAASFGPDYQGNPYQVEGGASEEEIKKATEDAAKAGVKYDPKTGKATLPNGNVVDASSLGTAAGVASAFGISKEQAQLALDKVNEKNRAIMAKHGDLSKYKLSFSGGGGGGAGIDGSRAPASEPNFNLNGLFGQRKPAAAKVAGLEKVVGGSTVGVATDDIFQMVRRRYQEKNKTDFFAK